MENQPIYKWEQDHKFIFSGTEFENLYKALHIFIHNNMTPQTILKAAEGFSIVHAKLLEEINSGSIKSDESTTEVV
jgi:hypothetical protein